MSGSQQVRVLVADDSVLMCLLIIDILKEDLEIEVVGKASNGKEAFLLCNELKPDVVLMDMTMGAYGGLYGVKKIMSECPTPIVILSALGNTNMEPIIEVLKMGAIDYLSKPVKNTMDMREVGAVLIEKVKMASKVSLKEVKRKQIEANQYQHSFDKNTNYDIIVIGASTGGPTAVEEVITRLPKNMNVPILVVQHMPVDFVPSFAARLNRLTPLNVRVAKKGEVLKPGDVLLAPGDKNMIVRGVNEDVLIDFTYKNFEAYNHPSVDSVLLSVAKIYGKRSIGVILTGMGKDGAKGLKAVKDAGGYTIVQSKSSCVVYGMPRAAVENEAVIQVVNLDEIGGFLVSCFN